MTPSTSLGPVVLVTGGTGFIGRAVVARLQALGKSVVVLSRSAQSAEGAVEARLAAGQVMEIPSLREIDSTLVIDAIINLAGEPLAKGRWTRKRKQRFVESRQSVTADLLDLVKRLQTKPRVLVNGSAIGWYGARQDERLTEQAEPAPSFSHELCERWEQAARRIGEQGVRVCCLRIGVVLGPGGGALTELRRSFQFKLAAQLGSGKQWMSWIHMTDLVELMMWIVRDEPIEGAVNGTAPEPVTNAEFTDTLAGFLNPWLRVTLPSWLLQLLLGEMAEEMLLTGQRVVPARAETAGYQFQFPRLTGALKDILG